MKHLRKQIVFTPEVSVSSIIGSVPKPSSTCLPDWYKEIPQFRPEKDLVVFEGGNNASVKLCVPFLDAMTAGYMFVLNQDIHVTWNESGSPYFGWRTEETAITFHSPNQYEGIAVPDGHYPQVIKFANPFVITLDHGYSLFCTHPSNRFDLPFQTISGFVDADKHPLAIQFPFFIKQGWSGTLKMGTPVAQLIPVKRDSWSSKTEPFSEITRKKRHHSFFSTVVRSYKTKFWEKKIYQ